MSCTVRVFSCTCRLWDTSLLEIAVESLTEELSQCYDDRPVDNYKISVAAAFFFKFFHEVFAKTQTGMVISALRVLPL